MIYVSSFRDQCVSLVLLDKNKFKKKSYFYQYFMNKSKRNFKFMIVSKELSEDNYVCKTNCSSQARNDLKTMSKYN